MVNAMENIHMVQCDIPGAFVQSDINEKVHMKLDGNQAPLLIRVNPLYWQFVVPTWRTRYLYQAR